MKQLFLLVSLLLSRVFGQDEKPNLVIVYTDQHNFRTIGAYRDIMSHDQAFVWGEGVSVETPNLDALAKRGALFSNFYAASALCTPSRSSFMTGLYPRFTGAWENHDVMDDDMTTFAQILKKKKGYSTAYVGKWHLDGEDKPGWGGDRGVRKFGFTDIKYLYNRGHWKCFEESNGETLAYEWNECGKFNDSMEKNYATDFLFDRGIEFIEKNAKEGNPFAIMMSIPDPHHPYQVRAPYDDLYKDLTFKLPASAQTAFDKMPALPIWSMIKFDLERGEDFSKDFISTNQQNFQRIFGMVKLVDDNIGKLMKSLKQAGVRDNTIVVFTSDHGDLMGEHAKNHKGRPYETSAGVPFIISFPNRIPRGKVVNTAYSSVDFTPTILSLMNVQYPGVEFQGIDGSEEFLAPKWKPDDDRQLRFITDSRRGMWAAAVMNGYKLVVSKSDYPYLFDFKKDPDEVENFFGMIGYEEISSYMQDALFQVMKDKKFPLADENEFFWSKPACMDSKDQMRSWSSRVCTDLKESEHETGCQFRSISDLCPVTCRTCCEDSVGKMWFKGNLKSCENLKNKCDLWRVKAFCPDSCDSCFD